MEKFVKLPFDWKDIASVIGFAVAVWAVMYAVKRLPLPSMLRV